jgi:hypothetical protein
MGDERVASSVVDEAHGRRCSPARTQMQMQRQRQMQMHVQDESARAPPAQGGRSSCADGSAPSSKRPCGSRPAVLLGSWPGTTTTDTASSRLECLAGATSKTDHVR